MVFYAQVLHIVKAYGVDYIKNEMLLPIQHLTAFVLLVLFQLCQIQAHVPEIQRVAQAVSIYKKNIPADPGKFRPISLTSIFLKTLEHCLQNNIQFHSLFPDIAQGEFRECCGSLNQAFCLAEIYQVLGTHHKVSLILAFLGIEPAYDTVDRNLVWKLYSHPHYLHYQISFNTFWSTLIRGSP